MAYKSPEILTEGGNGTDPSWPIVALAIPGLAIAVSAVIVVAILDAIAVAQIAGAATVAAAALGITVVVGSTTDC